MAPYRRRAQAFVSSIAALRAQCHHLETPKEEEKERTVRGSHPEEPRDALRRCPPLERSQAGDGVRSLQGHSDG